MTLDRGTRNSRNDTTARSPVSARFVLPSFFRETSPSFFNDAALPSALSRPFSSPPLLLSSSERRQVGVRAAVNSPAPLSTLMSLLLFALLNAIRAYSVFLPPLLGPRATTSSLRLPRANVVVHARTFTHIHTREVLDLRRDSFALTRGLCNRYTNTHATRGRARTCAKREVSRRGDGGGIAISHRHASAHYCVISRTKTLP